MHTFVSSRLWKLREVLAAGCCQAHVLGACTVSVRKGIGVGRLAIGGVVHNA